MAPLLGGNTKVYRAYGKKATHTVNRAAARTVWESPTSSVSSKSSYKSAHDHSLSSPSTDYDDAPAPKQEKENRRPRRARAPPSKRASTVESVVISSSDSESDLNDSSVEIESPPNLSDESDDDDDSNDDSVEIVESSVYVSVPDTSSVVSTLLASCSTDRVTSFDDFVARPPRAVVGRHGHPWRKIGEASFSEVYRVNETVVKIMALHDPESLAEPTNEWPMLSSVDSVHREVEINKALCKVDGFVEFKGAYVVRGPFPASLLAEWDAFKAERVKQKHAEANIQARPGILPADQHFVLLCLADGGVDLEAFKVRSWREARSIFTQTAAALARAEDRFEFEHRDLHWGNILVREAQASLDDLMHNMTLTAKQSRTERKLSVSLIDFTLSRIKIDDGTVLHDDLADEELFAGEGNLQFDTYRFMRQLAKDDWQGFHPATNLAWLRYVAYKLVRSKGLAVPPAKSTTATPRSKRTARTRRDESAEANSNLRAEDRKAYEELRSWLAIVDKHVDDMLEVPSEVMTGRRKKRGALSPSDHGMTSTRQLLEGAGLWL